MAITRPPIIQKPFAESGDKNTIPVASQVGITDGAASFETGFPPDTMLDIGDGGIAPDGLDMNGILNIITQHIRFMLAGGYPRFDATLCTEIGGYPVGAVLQDNSGVNTYINVVDGNSVDFNTTSAAIGVSWLLYGSASALKKQCMIVHEEQAGGVPAGDSVTGVNVRALNTVISNTIAGASLGSSRITLPAGSYSVNASAPGMGNGHKLYFYNVTDSATSILGTAENTILVSDAVNGISNAVWTRSFCKGIITLTAQKVFELRHNFFEPFYGGLGHDVMTTQNAVYSEIIIDKVLI